MGGKLLEYYIIFMLYSWKGVSEWKQSWWKEALFSHIKVCIGKNGGRNLDKS